MPRLGKNRYCCSIEPIKGANQRGEHRMTWLVIGFWGCAAMWLISLAGDIGLARDERVAPGMQWLALISALLAFIGMCYFGAAANLFGWS
jgi:hypothetical protein